MHISNFKKVVPAAGLLIFGYLIAAGTVSRNYFLLMLIVMPVVTAGAIALVLGSSPSNSSTIKHLNRTSIFSNISMYIFMVVLLTGVSLLNYIAPGNPSFSDRFFASLIIIMGSVPALLHLKHHESGVPFLPLFGLIFSLYYGLPVFLARDFSASINIIPHNSLNKALQLSTAGLLMLYLAYYRLPGKNVAKYLPRISIYWNVQKAKFWSILFIVSGLTVNYLILIISIPARFHQAALFLSQLSLLGTGILFILQLQGKLNNAAKAILWGLVIPLLFLLRLGIGTIAEVLLLIIFLSLTYWTFQRKLPWKTAIGGMLILIVLLGARTDFRRLTWKQGGYEMSPIEKSVLFADMAFSRIGTSYTGYDLAVRRIAHIFSFAHVVDQTPGIVPYWSGKTYLTLLWTPIPRVLYADKPSKELGQAFGHRYRLLPSSDYTTSYNFPQLIEMYANFGVIGVLLGMFIVGIIYRSLHEIFCHIRAGEGGLLIGIILFTGLSNIEGDFSLIFAGLFYSCILLFLVSMLIKEKRTQ